MEDEYPIAELKRQLPKCACDCRCTYAMIGKASQEAGRCFRCRHDIHFGGTPLPRPQRRTLQQ